MNEAGLPLVLSGLDSPVGTVVSRALRTTSHPVYLLDDDDDAPESGGVLLAGGVRDAASLDAAVSVAGARNAALVLFDPAAEVAPLLLGGVAAGMVLSGGARATQMGPFLGALPWLRLPLPLDERGIQAAAHSRAQHRAGLVSHLRVSAAEPWLLGPGPDTSQATWALLARCLSRVVDLPWCVVVTPRQGVAADRAAAALRSLPPARVRIWPSPADTDRLALIVGCDLCIWPGSDEADVDLLLAAQAAGMPALACRGAASDECVRDGLTGRAVPAGNVESLANVLRFLLLHDEFRVSMARQAREIIIADHGLAAVGRVLATFLARRSPPPG